MFILLINFQFGKDSAKTAFLYSTRHQRHELALSECSLMYERVDVDCQLGPHLWLWLEHLYVAFPGSPSVFVSMMRVAKQRERQNLSCLEATHFHFSFFYLLEESH